MTFFLLVFISFFQTKRTDANRHVGLLVNGLKAGNASITDAGFDSRALQKSESENS